MLRIFEAMGGKAIPSDHSDKAEGKKTNVVWGIIFGGFPCPARLGKGVRGEGRS